MIVAVPAALTAVIASFDGHWIVAAVLAVIAVLEAHADGRNAEKRRSAR